MSKTDEVERVVAELRRPIGRGQRDDGELVRAVCLAASSHNTQPWRFEVTPTAVVIRPDRHRRCPVVDPDDAHLYRSLGCAAENLVVAASGQGLGAKVRYDAVDDAVVVDLAPDPDVVPSPWLPALPTRQCTRLPFDGTTLPPEHLARLEEAVRAPNVRAVLLTGRTALESFGELVARGDRAQLRDRRFRSELLRWVRFNAPAELRRRDGLAGRCSRQPALPTWLGRALAPFVITSRVQEATDRHAIATSAAVAVLLASDDTPATWVEVGRAVERMLLEAASLDVRTAFVNQPIEVVALHDELARLVGPGTDRVQLAVRLGRGPVAPYSIRRRTEEVIER